MSNENDLYELPNSWKWVKLEEIISQINSGFPSGKHNQDNRGIPHLRPMNINSKGEIDLSILKYVEEFKDYISLRQGDILFNNTNSPVWLGKTTYIKQNTNWAYSNHMTRIQVPQHFINSGWVAYGLHQLCLNGYFRSNCTNHVNQASINSNFLLKNVSLPLAPIEEQKRIVAKIEELFTELDAGVELLKKLQIKLKRYRQSVLKAAVEGNLTKEWRTENQDKLEPANQLLDRILKERQEKWEAEQLAKFTAQGKLPKDDSWKLKYQEPSPPDVSNLPALPNGWCWASLDQIAIKITDGEHIRPNIVNKGVYFLSAKDIRNEGIYFDNPLFVSEDDAEKFRSRCNPGLGDILIVSRGATVGRSCIVNTEKLFCLLGSVILIKLDLQILSQFIFYAIKSPDIQKNIVNLSGSTAQQAIYIRDIRKAFIPIPSLLEQVAITEEIELRLSVIDQIETTIQTNLKRAEKLRQSILKQAFQGKLVEQDPNDEPAAKLLERIKAEKAKEEPKRISKRKPKEAAKPNKEKEP